MSIKYKIDIMEALKNKGYSSYRIRKEKLFGQKTLQDFRDGTVVLSQDLLSKLCGILGVQPGDLLIYVSDDPTGMTEKETQAERQAKDRTMILEATKNGSTVEVKTKSKKNHHFSLENLHKN